MYVFSITEMTPVMAAEPCDFKRDSLWVQVPLDEMKKKAKFFALVSRKSAALSPRTIKK